MSKRMVRGDPRRTLLIGAIVALSVGTATTAVAQPGSSFQTRGERESAGKTAVPSPYSRSLHPPEAYGEWYGSPGRFVVPGYGWYAYGGYPWVGYPRFGRYHRYRY
jgi:hypothetical protein